MCITYIIFIWFVYCFRLDKHRIWDIRIYARIQWTFCMRQFYVFTDKNIFAVRVWCGWELVGRFFLCKLRSSRSCPIISFRFAPNYYFYDNFTSFSEVYYDTRAFRPCLFPPAVSSSPFIRLLCIKRKYKMDSHVEIVDAIWLRCDKDTCAIREMRHDMKRLTTTVQRGQCYVAQAICAHTLIHIIQ